jgi:hypothetical protein
MKNKSIKFYSTILFFFTNFMLFALPGDGSDTGDLENTEPTAASIDNQFYVLLIVGILFAVYTFRKSRKTV